MFSIKMSVMELHKGAIVVLIEKHHVCFHSLADDTKLYLCWTKLQLAIDTMSAF